MHAGSKSEGNGGTDSAESYSGDARGARPRMELTFMMTLRSIVVTAATAVLLTGCMHRHSLEGYAGGDVPIDSLSASRTAILRVDNSYPGEVHVYAVVGGHRNYVAKAMNGQVRTWVLDPQMFPAEKISFEAESKDGSMKRVLGPFRVNRGETVEIVLPPDFDAARATVHRSTR